MKHHAPNQGAQLTRKAKRSSAANHDGSGLLGSVLGRRSAAMPATTPAPKGLVRPHAKLLALLAISLLALFATTASASAAPPTTTTPVVSDVAYTSVHVTGKVSSPAEGGGFLKRTEYSFQYSTDGITWIRGPVDGFFGVATDKEVFGDINGLKGGTEYFVRLTAEYFEGTPDEAVSPGPNPSFTTLAVDPPTIPGAVEASPVFSTSATAIGKVKRPANPADPKPGADDAFDVNCHFDYITDDQYKANELATEPLFQGATPVPCKQNPIKAADAGIEKTVEADFAPGTLTPSTTYHLRLVAENAAPGGPVIKEAANFTTAAKVAGPTVTAVNDASEVKFNVATLTGKVLRPAGADPALDVNCKFEYVTDAKFQPLSEQQKLTLTNATGGTFTLSFAGETTTPIAFDASAAQVQSALESLSSIGAGSVSVSDGYAIDFTGALGGKDVEQISVDPSALEEAGVASAETTTVTEGHVGGFESPAAAACEQNPITAAKVDGAGEMKVSAKPGLVATTKYHFRLVAENEGGSDTKDAAATFTTPEAELPTVTIDPVEGGTFTTAHVSGTVTLDKGHSAAQGAVVQFSTDGGGTWAEYGGTMAFTQPNGEHRALGSLGDEEGTYVVEQDLTGLQPSTTYSFRIANTYSNSSYPIAETNGEVAFSPEPNPEITTEAPQAPPTAENLAVTDITATSAHFSGTVNPNAPAGPLSGPAKKAYETKWHFECAPECKDHFGNEVGGTVQGEEGPQPVAADLEGLDPNTEYTVSLIVSSGIPGEPAVKTFSTLKSPPSVKQTPGASDGTGGYTLQGVVNPNNETITDCKFKWGPSSNELVFSADCSPMPTPGVNPTTVEAHLTGLNSDVDYYSQLVVTYGAGLKADSGDPQAFKATLAVKEPCPANEQLRVENSSLALPECRAYEMVTPPGKEGFGAGINLLGTTGTYDGGDRVAYISGAGNIAKSGQGSPFNRYVAARTASGWETIPNLNGTSGSLRDAPNYVDSNAFTTNFLAYSQDLRSSLWRLHQQGDPGGTNVANAYLRNPDGTFAPVGSVASLAPATRGFVEASDDLSHVITSSPGILGSTWGPGVYEFIGTGMDQPRRVDLDNSGSPVSTCIRDQGVPPYGAPLTPSTIALSLSGDGGTVLYRAYGALNAVPSTCAVDSPPADEIWARINGTTAIDVSASHCDRLDCNAPANPTFIAATPDGSRVFFTTKQQLVDEDHDQTNDLYACDLPSGNPAPSTDKANPCATFRQVSGAQTGAEVESVGATAENGSTVLFTAKGKLANNKDAFGEEAVAGDHNLYAWRADAAHPDGQTAFLARLEKNDVGSNAQATPDGRYLVFTTTNQLLDTDTDTARDVYRYDADTGDLTRISTNVFGVAGNGDFDAQISGSVEHHPTTTISDDGTKIVFTTTEPLNLAVDNNDESDVYLWTPSCVSLISTGAVGKGGAGAYVTASGKDIYFGTSGALTPADGDDVGDIYDARIDGGFSFAPPPICTGETCQPPASGPLAAPAPATAQPPADPGNVKPCPKGKVRKKNGKCVPKHHKKHQKKSHKKAGHNRGGSK